MKLLKILAFLGLALLLCACATTEAPPGDEGGEAHTHTYGGWIEDVPAGCTTPGVEASYCTCGDKLTRPIEPGHRYALSALDISQTPEKPYGGTFTCAGCGDFFESTVTHEDLGMPIVTITGSLEEISKENKVTVAFDYQNGKESFSCTATLKVQGATSAEYPKKNYSVQFFEKDGSKKKVELVDGWGEESKYCMKANWTDLSAARNVVSAKLYGDVARSLNVQDEFSDLVNGGAIDGFPIAVYHDGAFLGLYTMNIPKDKWMMGMEQDESLRQAIIMGDQWHESVSLRRFMSYDFVSTSWDLEYCSTEDDPVIGTNWAVDSFNRMMWFVMANDGETFRRGIGDYINVDRAIDALIYTWMICGLDNTSKNILWATYDGTVWTPCVYDLDSTWGLWWDASKLNPAGVVKNWNNTSINMLFYRLRFNYQDEILARYIELRKGPMSNANVEKKFIEFFESIPDALYAAEAARWPENPGLWIDHETQILTFTRAHLDALDEAFYYGSW